MGLRRTNIAAWKIGWPQANVSNFVRTSKILAINCNNLINDSIDLICVCTYGNECYNIDTYWCIVVIKYLRYKLTYIIQTSGFDWIIWKLCP